MSKEKDIVQNVYKNLSNSLIQLVGMRETYEQQEQDILHYIEFQKYDAVTGSKLLKRLREIRKERRDAKDDFDYLLSIKTRMRNSGLPEKLITNKHYVYRSSVIRDVLGDNSKGIKNT